tara:strand:+ start:35 stop:367 length:333 start_codon:yes stop_codon:yes gene_type:complete
MAFKQNSFSGFKQTGLKQMSAPPREPSIESLSPQISASKPSLPPKIRDYHNHTKTKIKETLLESNPTQYKIPDPPQEMEVTPKHYTGGVRRANTPQVDPYLEMERLGRKN